MTFEELKEITNHNTQHIKQLNENMMVLDANMSTLLNSVKDSLRDVVLIQQTLIQFLAEKGIISEDSEDQKLFQKIYARNVAAMDQETAQRRDIFKPKDKGPDQ